MNLAEPMTMMIPVRKSPAVIISAAAVFTILFYPQVCLRAQTPTSADRTSSGAGSVDPARPPNATVTQTTYITITGKQRAAEFIKRTVSPLSFVSSAASAGLGQWRDRPPEWKQGAEGYGRRYASSFAAHIVNESLLYGASSLFQEDNRYIRSGQASVGARLGYALGNTFEARGNDGVRHLSRSKLIALAGAALISRLWQPHSTRKLKSAGASFGTSIAVNMGFQVVKEFWPQ